jgi:hypothetical protein
MSCRNRAPQYARNSIPTRRQFSLQPQDAKNDEQKKPAEQGRVEFSDFSCIIATKQADAADSEADQT